MKTSIFVAITANGQISNSRNVADWLSPEYGQGLFTICQKYKAVIMGKTTYNILAPNYLPLTNEGTTVVLTTDKQAKSDNPTVVFTQKNSSEIVQMLIEKGHKEAVIIGGTMTMSEFINAGLVDDIYLVMEPVIFGSGLPLLKNVELELKLNLLEVKKLNDNTVQLHYKVQKQS
ncbi:dihydrofolate reductase [Pedobacter sp. SD-b]|uniref:Dihydrofolate reductase n=1 Tax=Pedobacter segetis TaxID=2793069 RepID=A0ABS1BJD9_9SPHI|nr:dihydrofolate reductase family protein [Pedobacter segetis]MBK0383000.1 dihydrofolate reductase [Pedobacter segetis]